MVEDLIKIAPGHSPQFEEVLCGCLQPHPEARLTPEQLLELEWFRQFRDPAAVGKSVAVGATENGQEGVTPGQVKSGGEDCDANNGDIENQVPRVVTICPCRVVVYNSQDYGVLPGPCKRQPFAPKRSR